MNLKVLGDLPLLCPECQWQASSLRNAASPLELAYASKQLGEDEVLEGGLICPTCRSTYPILDGIPVVVKDLKGFLQPRLWQFSECQRSVEVVCQLLSAGPEWTQYLDLSSSIDSNWGDHTNPPPETWLAPACGQQSLNERLRERVCQPVDRQLDLGTGLGRSIAEMAPTATLSVGVDLNLASLTRARRILRGEPLPYARRITGTQYLPAEVQAPELARTSAVLICADALNLPFPAGTFGRVVAANLIDKVPAPAELLHVMDAQCGLGGEIIVTAPLIWDPAITLQHNRLGRLDPGAHITELFRSGGALSSPYSIEDVADLPWWIRSESRLSHVYRNYYLRARKRFTSGVVRTEQS